MNYSAYVKARGFNNGTLVFATEEEANAYVLDVGELWRDPSLVTAIAPTTAPVTHRYRKGHLIVVSPESR